MKSYSLIILMNCEEVLAIHNNVISRFGGRPGIHDRGLLDSAVNHPWMIIKYGAPEEHEIYNLATAYFFHIIKNHPFIDGNKRTGLLTALEFLYQNGFELNISNDDLYQLALDTASSNINETEVAIIFKNRLNPLKN